MTIAKNTQDILFNFEDRLFAYSRLVLAGAAFIYYSFFLRILHMGPEMPLAGLMLTLFLLWSGIVTWSIRSHIKKQDHASSTKRKWIVALSLPCDLGFVYYSAHYTGGLTSPFFVAIFLLIVFHAYYFPFDLRSVRRSKARWLASGTLTGLSGGFSFLLLYLFLAPQERIISMDFMISLFFAFMLALTAGVLRYHDKESNRKLRRSNELMQLFRGIIKQVNELYSGVDSTQDHFLDDLAKTIGENLHAISCEVFTLRDNNEFQRRGLWVRPAYEKHNCRQILADHDEIHLGPDYAVGKESLWRVGRYEKKDPLFAAHANPIGVKIQDFLAYDAVRHCLFTLILRKSPTGARVPIGVIRVTNRLDSDGKIHAGGFTPEDETVIQEVAAELSIAIENFRLQALEHKTLDKERRLRQLALKDDLDEIMLGILSNMAEMVDANYAELWVPFEDGFERKQKFVLRSFYPATGHLAENLSEEQRCIDAEASYIGHLIEGMSVENKIVYEADLRSVKHFAWAQYIDRFGSTQFIAILLDHIDRHLGVVCLHPDRNFEWDENYRAQLTEFAELAIVSIEGARYRRRYEQLRRLQKGLDRLLEKDDGDFYNKAAVLVGEVLPAEACSIFTIDHDNHALILNGTNDSSPEAQTKIGTTLCRFDSSISGQVAATTTPVMVHGDLLHRESPKNIFEKTTNPPTALIASPVLDSANNVIAVIRCINKIRQRDIVTTTFSNADMEIFELIVGIIGAFIENRRNFDRLERINKQRQNFLGSIAHEFTSPLHSIRMTAEFLRKYHNSKERLKDPDSQFEFLIDEVDFLNYLISNIRIQDEESRTAYLPGPKTEESLFKIIEKIQTLLKGQAKEKGLDIRLVGEFPTTTIDKFHLEQVFFNLLVNAIKYTPRNSPKPIEIVCEKAANFVIIIFRNWGIGVRSTEASRIFEMFERGMNAFAGSITGTGLGLYISRKIMTNMGGDLKLTKLDKPTEFTVFLPTE